MMQIPLEITSTCSLAEFLKIVCRHEMWRPIGEFETYEVSSHGRVRRVGSINALIPSWTHGYAHVSLSVDGQAKTKRVHRLVAQEFLGEPPFQGAVLAHNDGDRLNNRADNIRWASLEENQEDRRRHGTKTCGSAVKCAKLHETDIPKIRERLQRGETCVDIAQSLSVSTSTISLIQRDKIWRHV